MIALSKFKSYLDLTTYFSNEKVCEERIKLRNVLIVLLNELDEATNIDFADALKMVVEAKV
jgi:hypothetical protein